MPPVAVEEMVTDDRRDREGIYTLAVPGGGNGQRQLPKTAGAGRDGAGCI